MRIATFCLLLANPMGIYSAHFQNNTTICPRVGLDTLRACPKDAETDKIISQKSAIIELNKNGEEYFEHRMIDNQAQVREFCLPISDNRCFSSSNFSSPCRVPVDKNVIQLHAISGKDEASLEELIHQVFHILSNIFEKYNTVYVAENHYSEACCLFRENILEFAKMKNLCVFQEAAYDNQIETNLFYGLSTTNPNLMQLKSLHGLEELIDESVTSLQDVLGFMHRVKFCKETEKALENLDMKITKAETDNISNFFHAFKKHELDYTLLSNLYQKAQEQVDKIREEKWRAIIDSVDVEKKLVILGADHIESFIRQTR